MSELVNRSADERSRDLAQGLLALASIERPHVVVVALCQALALTVFKDIEQLDREEALQLALKRARFHLREMEAPQNKVRR
jgi:hypothetical protein